MSVSPLRLALLACGFIVWVVVGMIAGRAEAWDSGLYFVGGYPLMLLLAGGAGFFRPGPGWRYGLWMAAGQCLALMLTGFINQMGLGLWPLAFVAITVCSLPLCLAAAVGAWLGRRFRTTARS
jgi:hypothetical protein